MHDGAWPLKDWLVGLLAGLVDRLPNSDKSEPLVAFEADDINQPGWRTSGLQDCGRKWGNIRCWSGGVRLCPSQPFDGAKKH